jgi:hypothetical protein
MNDTLEDELRAMYRRHSSQLPTHGPGLGRADAIKVVPLRRPEARGRRGVLVVAASVAVLGGTGGLWVVNHRQTEAPGTTDTVPPASTVPAQITPGHWTLDAPPDGLQLDAVNEAPYAGGSDQPVMRVYASASPTPERDPVVLLSSYPDEVATPGFALDARAVDVGGVMGKQWTRLGRDMVAVHRDGYWYQLETAGIADPVALAATAQRAPDDHGAVIDTALLPPGVAQAGVGAVEEVRFFNTDALAHPIPIVHWETSSRDAGVFYESIVESPAQFRLHRIEYPYTSITDVSVNGHPALTLSGDHFVTVTWNDGQRTMIVTGYNVPPDVARGVATSLRPASDLEWTTMAVRARTAQASASTNTMAVVTSRADG